MSYGIGGIVAQVEVAGKRRCPVAYHSHRVRSWCWVKKIQSESLRLKVLFGTNTAFFRFRSRGSRVKKRATERELEPTNGSAALHHSHYFVHARPAAQHVPRSTMAL